MTFPVLYKGLSLYRIAGLIFRLAEDEKGYKFVLISIAIMPAAAKISPSADGPDGVSQRPCIGYPVPEPASVMIPALSSIQGEIRQHTVMLHLYIPALVPVR